MKKPGHPLQIAVLISGRGSNMHALIQQTGKYQICLVVSNKPADGLNIADQQGVPTCLVSRRDFDSKSSHEAALADAIEPAGQNGFA